MGNLGGHSWGNALEPLRLLTQFSPLALLKAANLIFTQGDLIGKSPSFLVPTPLVEIPRHLPELLDNPRPSLGFAV